VLEQKKEIRAMEERGAGIDRIVKELGQEI
jgi:hypothetical protein